MQNAPGHLRTTLAAIAAGASLDDALREIAGAVVASVGSGSCKVWLVKQGDICAACQLAPSCQDRSLCLHLKAAEPALSDEPPRVPLVVFRDRIAARGGVARAADAGVAGRLLFGPGAVARSGTAVVAIPLKGPAGVVGLLAVLADTPPSAEQVDAVRSLADAAVVAIRIADMTSRYQRATLQLEESAEAAAEVAALLHAILYGSTEYDVIAEDLEGNITVFSEGARTTYGYSPDEVIGRVRADVLYAPEEIESGKVVEVLNEAMTTGRCEAIVTRLRKNGERFPARATFTVRRDGDGDPSGFVIVERDLSAERNSARLTETAAQQVAQLQDHVQSLKSSYALLERAADELRCEKDELLERLGRLQEVDELNAIRSEIIRDLRAKLDRLATRPSDAGAPARGARDAVHPVVDFSNDIGAEPESVFGVGSTLLDGATAFAVTIRREEPTD